MNGLEHLLSAEVQRHPSSGSLGQLRSLGRELHVAAENRRRQLIPDTGQEQFGPIRPRLRLRAGRFRVGRFRAGLGQCPPVKLAPHIALGKNTLHRVVIAQEERCLVRL
jgi:hypothetical protein